MEPLKAMSSPRAVRSSGTAELCVRARSSRSGSRKAYPRRSINRSSSPRAMVSVRSPRRGTEELLGRAQLRGGQFFCFVGAGFARGLQAAGDGSALREGVDGIFKMRGFLVRDAQQVEIDGIGNGVELDGLFEIWNCFGKSLAADGDKSQAAIGESGGLVFGFEEIRIAQFG